MIIKNIIKKDTPETTGVSLVDTVDWDCEFYSLSRPDLRFKWDKTNRDILATCPKWGQVLCIKEYIRLRDFVKINSNTKPNTTTNDPNNTINDLFRRFCQNANTKM